MHRFITLCLLLSTVFGLGSPWFLPDLSLSALTTQEPRRQSAAKHTRIKDGYQSSHHGKAEFPAVTLPYGIYQPAIYNYELSYLHYKDIRYGQPPTGPLRFAPPVPPEAINGTLPVFNGTGGHSCHQAAPQWLIEKLNATGVDWETYLRTETDGEDCLFLDVATPMDTETYDRFPVLVWIYGGGYAYGAKDMPLYNPSGFFRTADGIPFVYVALNYRLGAFGFLGGPKFTSQGGQPNLGLYDQRLALQWVQDNIAEFGGDPNKVTVMGESAGAGSIVHHLVWDDTSLSPKTPFQKAIIQSPAWVPSPGSEEGLKLQDGVYDKFVQQANSTDLAGARNMTETEIRNANRELVRLSSYGTFTIGPVVDNFAIPFDPLALLKHGRQDQSIEIFTGVVGAEGLPFVPIKELPLFPNRNWTDWTDTQLENYIHNALPLVSNDTANYILELYQPTDPKYQSYLGLSKQTQRVADIAGQALVQCNARGISTSYHNKTYNYIFKIAKSNFLNLPLIHGQDVPYTFFNVPTSHSSDINSKIARNWQKYIMGFVLFSDPNMLSPKTWITKYGHEANVVQFDWVSTTRMTKDTFRGKRCDEDWPGIWEGYGVSVENVTDARWEEDRMEELK